MITVLSTPFVAYALKIYRIWCRTFCVSFIESSLIDWYGFECIGCLMLCNWIINALSDTLPSFIHFLRHYLLQDQLWKKGISLYYFIFIKNFSNLMFTLFRVITNFRTISEKYCRFVFVFIRILHISQCHNLWWIT